MKRLALAAALVVAFTSMTYAQKSSGSTVNIGANIINGLIVSGPSGTLYFGDATYHNIVQGAAVKADTVVLLDGTDNRAVNFSVTGDAHTAVVITIPASATLTNGGSGSVTYTPSVAYNTSSTSAASSTSISTAGTFYPGGGSTQGTLYNNETEYIWVGGTLASPSTATPGAYTGSITFTVAYSGE